LGWLDAGGLEWDLSEQRRAGRRASVLFSGDKGEEAGRFGLPAGRGSFGVFRVQAKRRYA